MPYRCIVLCLAFLVSASELRADSPAERLLRKPDSWFGSDDGRTVLSNVLSWQTRYGDWPKNTDTTSSAFTGDGEPPAGTFDNGATTGELRLLAKAFRVTGQEELQRAFLRGLDHILTAQYPHGGWPQFYPLSDKYHRHVTFNDGTMIRLMEFLRDVSESDDFEFVDRKRRVASGEAVARGVECIVKCQIRVEGRLTVWCAQHDAETLAPTKARSYELSSLSGAESAGVLRFLMSLEEPSPDVVRAVHAAAAWFQSSGIDGYRYARVEERSLSPDADAPRLWARFYEIETNRPIFCDRDGIVKYNLEDIGRERRNGYTWYGTWGAVALKDYGKWCERRAITPPSAVRD